MGAGSSRSFPGTPWIPTSRRNYQCHLHSRTDIIVRRHQARAISYAKCFQSVYERPSTRYVITYSPPRAWNSCRSLPETTDVFSDPWKRAPMFAIVIAVTLRRPTGCLVAWATPCRHATLVNWRKWRYSIALEDVARPMPPRYDCRSPIVWNPYAPRTTAKSNYSARGPTAPRLPVSSAVPLFANTPEECTRIPGGKKRTHSEYFVTRLSNDVRSAYLERRDACWDRRVQLTKCRDWDL